MNKALIIYGSSTGNTEFTAETIESALSEKGYDVTLADVSKTDVDMLKEKYDLYLLGSSTWGEDEIEFQEDFQPFYEEMASSQTPMDGKSFAIFGCGDSSYTYFCGAVDVLEDWVQKSGATLVCKGLRIDGEPEEAEINEWTQEVTNAV